MNKIVIGVVVIAGIIVYLRVRAGYVTERKAVLGRLQEEERLRGSSSPTDVLFRNGGLPEVQSSGATPAVPAVPPIEADADPRPPAGDVSQLFSGISMPAGLVPRVDDSYSESVATFVTSALA